MIFQSKGQINCPTLKLSFIRNTFLRNSTQILRKQRTTKQFLSTETNHTISYNTIYFLSSRSTKKYALQSRNFLIAPSTPKSLAKLSILGKLQAADVVLLSPQIVVLVLEAAPRRCDNEDGLFKEASFAVSWVASTTLALLELYQVPLPPPQPQWPVVPRS